MRPPVTVRPPTAALTRPLSPMTDHSSVHSHTVYTTHRQPAAYALGAPPSAAGSDPLPAAAPEKKKRIRLKTERRREQCRTNQARYRNKQNQLAQELECSVVQLRQQILQLEAQKRALTLRINTNNPATRVVMEYCRLFARGLAADDHQRPRRSHLPTLDEQERFVMASFHHNACIGGVYGSESFLELAGNFTKFYGGLRLLAEGYTSVSTSSPYAAVQAHVLVELTITESTIRYVYPHLLDPKYEAISRKLLGQRLKCRSTNGFVFDEDSKVVSHDWAMDFATVLQDKLSMEEIAIVLRQTATVRHSSLLEREAMRDESQDGELKGDTVDWLEDKRPVEHSDEGYLIHDGKGDDYVMV